MKRISETVGSFWAGWVSGWKDGDGIGGDGIGGDGIAGDGIGGDGIGGGSFRGLRRVSFMKP